LVFSKDKSPEGIKEGLMQRRTVAFYKDYLIGRPEYLKPLIEASIVITKTVYEGKSNVLNVTLKNQSSCTFILKNAGKYLFHNQGDVLTVPAQGELVVQVKVLNRIQEVSLSFEVMNGIIAPNKHPVIEWKSSIQQ
jgi:hypothetical protein